MKSNEAAKQLGIPYPIVQAPMAGGVTTPELVAAVSNAGGLGMLGAGYLTPDQTRTQIQNVKQLTSKPFGINLFVPNEFHAAADEVQAAHQHLHTIQAQLSVTPETSLTVPEFSQLLESFKEQVKVVIEEQVPVCSFTFGLPSKETIDELKQHPITLIGTATTVKEAVENEKAGMDLVVVQGSEAGGHRGNFLAGHQESFVGLLSLIPQVADHVQIPVVAAGGIMDSRGIKASFCLGAQGVQMGTAFLTCAESGAHHVHKEAVLQAAEDDIIMTRAFSGKWARGIQNKFTEEMKEQELRVPDFPVQNTLTQSIRKASSDQNNPDFMSLWSGQSPRLAKKQTVAQLMDDLVAALE
ncbi:NAD(P)H-dependent flavin oxidoreductase [Domibacillus enclensis]|uniref:Probable nitronate monooxygenase n=1 Tax=Domibacillus enclensis TaxID=1017273 RepID=A0A1N6N645_9BACI|nr:nitronate monooxygenase [Domibacillus enclensis]OXS79920.1 nitronate monooxygenase [Domibacillus enclensis]SIP87578.1 nitronate monooxygenase [Domibacillus enclensis]